MSFKDRVRALKEKNDSVLVAHNYQRDIIQESADYVGDSFGLSVRAKEAKEEMANEIDKFFSPRV